MRPFSSCGMCQRMYLLLVMSPAPLGIDAHQVELGKASGQKEGVIEIDQAGDVLLGRSIDEPEQIAGVGVVTGDRLAARQDQLRDSRLARGLDQDGGAVGARLVGPIDTPLFLPGVLVQGDEVGGGVLVAVEDEQVLVQDRRGAKAMHRRGVCPATSARFPCPRSRSRPPPCRGIAGRRPRRACRRCRGCCWQKLFSRCFLSSLDWSTSRSQITLPSWRFRHKQHAFRILLQAAGQEDAVAPDDRRGMALAGNGGFPEDVLGLAPLERNAGLHGGAIQPRPTPAGPIFRTEVSVDQDNQSNEQGQSHQCSSSNKKTGSPRPQPLAA